MQHEFLGTHNSTHNPTLTHISSQSLIALSTTGRDGLQRSLVWVGVGTSWDMRLPGDLQHASCRTHPPRQSYQCSKHLILNTDDCFVVVDFNLSRTVCVPDSNSPKDIPVLVLGPMDMSPHGRGTLQVD